MKSWIAALPAAAALVLMTGTAHAADEQYAKIARVYNTYCVQCHGINRDGKVQLIGVLPGAWYSGGRGIAPSAITFLTGDRLCIVNGEALQDFSPDGDNLISTDSGGQIYGKTVLLHDGEMLGELVDFRFNLGDGRITDLNEFARLGAVRVKFLGGEPLLREDVDALISETKRLGMRAAMVTNGFLVPQRFATIQKLDELVISLDGSEATHDRQRG